jgi:hypothetical protein
MARLKTETDTPAMEQRVTDAATAALGLARFSVDFEHGQWWVTDLDTGAQWGVHDATGGDSVDGFSFEQVADGEEG